MATPIAMNNNKFDFVYFTPAAVPLLWASISLGEVDVGVCCCLLRVHNNNKLVLQWEVSSARSFPGSLARNN